MLSQKTLAMCSSALEICLDCCTDELMTTGDEAEIAELKVEQQGWSEALEEVRQWLQEEK